MTDDKYLCMNEEEVEAMKKNILANPIMMVRQPSFRTKNNGDGTITLIVNSFSAD